VNVLLIALFGLQHSVMARQGFKRAWTRIVPPQAERSTFVLFASLALIVMFLFWMPIDGMVWQVGAGPGRTMLWALFGLGWLIVLLSTFLINHFELFGLQQAYLHARGREAAPPQMRQPLLYRYVRHPLYLGFFLAFWATPQMSLGHLLLAAGMSVYMLVAIRYEERDLVGMFGRDYQEYQARVGMLTPRMRRRA
jgi:protein-S-isoprenylcysteine O-methyltransferase Ste14